MATVEIFNGTLAPSATSAWVQVPESTLYMIAGLDGNVSIQFSIDGVNAFDIYNEPKVVNGAIGATGRADKLAGYPVNYMRVINRNTINPHSAIITVLG